MKYTIIFFILLTALGLNRLQAQIAVIAHQDVASDSITSAQLRDIYTGDMTFWPDGTPIIVCDLNDEQGVHDKFYDFIAVNSSRVKSVWMKRMLSGKSDPPLIFKTGDDLLQRIAELQGAIGFVDEKNIAGRVKVLMIIKTATE